MPTQTQEWILMAKLVSQTYSKADAEPFREPVDWQSLGLYDYPQIIKKPMDLGQIKRKIESNSYKKIEDAAEDIRLIWNNCMQYNADGSDFYVLAQNMAKKFEEKFLKLSKEVNALTTDVKDKSAIEPTLDERRNFANCLYEITKEELGNVITDIESKCPDALTTNSAEDEVEINVDHISPAVFHEVMAYVKSCCPADGSRRKKKVATTGRVNKKSRNS